jgi:hypothetical protein
MSFFSAATNASPACAGRWPLIGVASLVGAVLGIYFRNAMDTDPAFRRSALIGVRGALMMGLVGYLFAGTSAPGPGSRRHRPGRRKPGRRCGGADRMTRTLACLARTVRPSSPDEWVPLQYPPLSVAGAAGPTPSGAVQCPSFGLRQPGGGGMLPGKAMRLAVARGSVPLMASTVSFRPARREPTGRGGPR